MPGRSTTKKNQPPKTKDVFKLFRWYKKKWDRQEKEDAEFLARLKTTKGRKLTHSNVSDSKFRKSKNALANPVVRTAANKLEQRRHKKWLNQQFKKLERISNILDRIESRAKATN